MGHYIFHLAYSPGMTLRALESGFCSLPTTLLRTLRNSALLFAIRSHCLGEGGGLLRLLPSEHQKELKYSPVETFNTMGPFRLLFTVRGQVPNNRACYAYITTAKIPSTHLLGTWTLCKLVQSFHTTRSVQGTLYNKKKEI